ncbi:MAG: energy transducer TonB [Burkholderiales bacterium]|nr:energy transducer TonB [Burkholderiales bacterium]
MHKRILVFAVLTAAALAKVSAEGQPTTAADIHKLENEISDELRKYKVPAGERTHARAKLDYVEQWKMQVEQVMREHYPCDSKGRALRGTPIVTAQINQDGSLRSVRIDKSSGNRQLDAALPVILNLAAPFAPLPPDIIANDGHVADILSITRRYSFTADKLTSRYLVCDGTLNPPQQ